MADDDPSFIKAATVYILSGQYLCHECKLEGRVFGLMLSGPFSGSADCLDGIESEDDAPLLRRPLELPKNIEIKFVEMSAGHFRKDFSHTAGEHYWMNHCVHCDTKIGDWFVHKPGEAFFPTCDEELANVLGERIPGPWKFNSPELSVSSWTEEWLHRHAQEK